MHIGIFHFLRVCQVRNSYPVFPWCEVICAADHVSYLVTNVLNCNISKDLISWIN
jgi:hypothetical protein